jgi:tetratricopeptide (TPR) repeat protein
MKTPVRCASPGVALVLMVAAACWVAVPALGVVASQEQATPAPTSPDAGSEKPREVTLEQRGDIFMARKNYDNAVDYYYRALRQSSFKNAGLWNKMGIAFQQESKYRNAHKAYTNAIHNDKTFAEPWNNIGTIFSMEKKYAKSVSYFQHALKLKSDVAAFHVNLGSTYYHLKKYDLAVAEYRTALVIDPKVVSSDSAVGTVIHTGGTDVEYYFYMAKALASVGNAEVAVRYLRRALEDGFKDHQRIEDDPDFKKIGQYPAFVELMRNPPIAIKN